MYLKTLLMSSMLALAGCQSAEVITQDAPASMAVDSVQELTYHKMRVPSSKSVIINNTTQTLNSGQINSPVAAFELPADRGKLEIKITSQITESVFSPLVLIVDKQGNTIDSYDASVFEYRRPKFVLGDRLVAEIDFYPPTGHKFVDMLIYTSEDELKGQTFTVHPGRAMAEAKGNYMPELKDIPKPHATTGELLVEIDGAASFLSTSEPASGYKVPSNAQVSSIKVQPESADFYKSAIEKAVRQDDIPKALSLLEEAKALNIEGAQEVFVRAVNSRK